MCQKNGLTNKVEKAKDGLRFSKVQEASGKKAIALVPGSNMKTYKVIVRREGDLTTAECILLGGHNGYTVCKGSISTNAICYHAMTAVMKIFEEKGRKVFFCKDQEAAIKLSHFGGQVKCIANDSDRNKKQYFIVK